MSSIAMHSDKCMGHFLIGLLSLIFLKCRTSLALKCLLYWKYWKASICPVDGMCQGGDSMVPSPDDGYANTTGHPVGTLGLLVLLAYL